MSREISQRELRNDSGDIMRKLDEGETFIVTRNGVPVGELTPLRRHRFVAAEAAVVRHRRGLLDTSVVIDIETLDPSQLPMEVAVSALTLAELAAGPHATTDPEERGRRQDRLQRAEATFDPLPYDTDAARAYGRISPPSWRPGARLAVPERSICSSQQPPLPQAFRSTHATVTTS